VGSMLHWPANPPTGHRMSRKEMTTQTTTYVRVKVTFHDGTTSTLPPSAATSTAGFTSRPPCANRCRAFHSRSVFSLFRTTATLPCQDCKVVSADHVQSNWPKPFTGFLQP